MTNTSAEAPSGGQVHKEPLSWWSHLCALPLATGCPMALSSSAPNSTRPAHSTSTAKLPSHRALSSPPSLYPVLSFGARRTQIRQDDARPFVQRSGACLPLYRHLVRRRGNRVEPATVKHSSRLLPVAGDDQLLSCIDIGRLKSITQAAAVMVPHFPLSRPQATRTK